MNSVKNNKKTIIALAVLLVLVIGAIVAYYTLRPAAPDRDAALVTIEVEVTHGDNTVKSFSIQMEALDLRAALEQEELIAGDESQYGLFVKTVDGETVDESQQQWWCFMKDGEMLPASVDETLIADGDHYEIVLTVGW